MKTLFILDAAQALGVSRRTIYSRLADRRLHSERVGPSRRTQRILVDAAFRRERDERYTRWCVWYPDWPTRKKTHL